MNSLTSTANNVNVPNFSAMSKQELATIASLQFEKLQRLYAIIAMPNKVYSPAEKLVLLVAPDVLAREKPNERGLKRIDMGKVAEHIGLASETVATKVKNICERSNATRAVEPYTTRNGQKVNLVYVNDVEPAWAAPTTIEVEPEHLRNLPGDERRVCACGGVMHKKKRILRTQETWTCEECGDCIALHPVQELEPLEVTYTADTEAPHVADLLGTDASSACCRPCEPEIVTALDACTGFSDVEPPAPVPGVQFDNIPDELKPRKNFVGWRYGALRPNGKREKPVFNMRPGTNNATASVSNLLTWVDGFQAMARYTESHDPENPWNDSYQGIGYVFMQGDGYVGLDFDNCIRIIPVIDSTSGQWVEAQIEWTDEQALADVRAINSYTEISPSGTGVKVLTKSDLDCYVCSNPRGPEMYSDRHYFTLTGNRLDIVSHAIEERSESVQAIYERVAPKTPPLAIHTCASVPCRFSDEQVLDKALHGLDASIMSKLQNGDASDFLHKEPHLQGTPDYSRADFHFCYELTYWTHDPDQIARLMQASKLYRPDRWNSKARSGETYGPGTIREALQHRLGIAS